jgi:hypothetical protein
LKLLYVEIKVARSIDAKPIRSVWRTRIVKREGYKNPKRDFYFSIFSPFSFLFYYVHFGEFLFTQNCSDLTNLGGYL